MKLAELRELATNLWRYYQAGILNTLFGIALYALFVSLGLNRYVSQLVAHVLGVTFNYFTYSRVAFRDRDGSKFRFLLSYVGNYLLSAAILRVASIYLASPYAAGFIAVFVMSVLNYFVLKRLVFTTRRVGS